MISIPGQLGKDFCDSHLQMSRRDILRVGALVPADEVAAWVDAALAAAEQDGIAGKEVTPYLLRHIANVSGGRSLAANKALLIDNARVGGEIAVALAEGVS